MEKYKDFWVGKEFMPDWVEKLINNGQLEIIDKRRKSRKELIYAGDEGDNIRGKIQLSRTETLNFKTGDHILESSDGKLKVVDSRELLEKFARFYVKSEGGTLAQ